MRNDFERHSIVASSFLHLVGVFHCSMTTVRALRAMPIFESVFVTDHLKLKERQPLRLASRFRSHYSMKICVDGTVSVTAMALAVYFCSRKTRCFVVIHIVNQHHRNLHSLPNVISHDRFLFAVQPTIRFVDERIMVAAMSECFYRCTGLEPVI